MSGKILVFHLKHEHFFLKSQAIAAISRNCKYLFTWANPAF